MINPQIEKAIDLLRNQLETHWNQISEICDNSVTSKVSVSAGIRFDRAGKLPLVTVKISFGEKHKDDASEYVDDPNQAKLPIGEVV